jgi:DNA-binding transcriptional MerR regulator
MALKIGQVAERGGVNLQTIRYYERKGLLPKPPRLESGYRVFPESTVRRVRFIKRAQELGFSLAEIREILALRLQPKRSSSKVRSLAEAKIADIEERIRALRAIEAALTNLVVHCSGCSPISDCDSRKYRFGGDAAVIRWNQAAVAAPTVGVAMLPKLACPMCWPAYAGVLSALGLGFLISGTYLFWLTGAFLAVFVASLIFRASKRRGYGPAILGLTASAILFIAKFQLESTAVVYAALVFLVGASTWNSWPRPAFSSCPRCPSGGAESFNSLERKSNHETATQN